jgi:hypothetical protein
MTDLKKSYPKNSLGKLKKNTSRLDGERRKLSVLLRFITHRISVVKNVNVQNIKGDIGI